MVYRKNKIRVEASGLDGFNAAFWLEGGGAWFSTFCKEHIAFIIRAIFCLGQYRCGGAAGSARSEKCCELGMDRFHPP